ncbi:hypothetical protein N7539_003563 [Penicillium diatomitis]|uniref:DNA polymerase delta subunit 3 n=1 Tax=Penicillium diatomitis TaxID=2819901 RepID=A0A9W9XCT4_9EURO|nr:uncharacterized protein N7539_003563 [Penicillium diatomitis]KAJ5488673.1 hypothetical protein N7539_003563 [Penicillium diatomitis]
MNSKLYLAENVLNERHTVTYRSLSRSLKVHANRAKQILYEFHRTENAKRPHSVHATYVISGVQKPTAPPATNGHTKDEDEVMQSSPYLPSSMPNQEAASDVVSIASILLVREEDLEDAKATFESVKTIHVYSVQAAPLQDLNTLTTVCRELALTSTQDDPLECGSQWGMIQNRDVKRRSGTRPPPAAKAATTAKPESTVPAKRSLATKESAVRQENKPDESQPTSDSQSSVKSSSKSAAPQKGKSNLFSSFAKTKPPKPKHADSQATHSGADDVVPDDASEDDAEELFPESGDKAPSTNRETKKEREEKLKKMMEEEDADDEEMADADEEPQREPTPEEQPPPPPPSKAAELKEEVTVHGGRRRGRRQVMKKKTVKDEEGYLVTREEATWESFSEDEPAPPKKKPAVNVAKAKGKPTGQGNIMSFFGKK